VSRKLKILTWLVVGMTGYLQLASLIVLMPTTREWSLVENFLVILCIFISAALVSLGFCKIIELI
jgi:hypothetical protein